VSRGYIARAAAGRAKSAQTDAVARSSGLSSFRTGRPYSPDWGIERAVRNGWQRSVWVYRCVHAIATAQCKLPVVARRMEAGAPPDPFEGQEIPNHPIARLLNNRPSPNELAYSFRYRKHATDLLSPRGSFQEVIRNGLAEVLQLTLLPPHLTSPIPDPRTFVSGYEVQLGPGSAQKVTVRPESVIWQRRPHPIDPYSSMTPLEAAGLAVETDWEARLYQRNFLKNDGVPAGIISVKGQMTDDDAADIKRQVTGGGGPRNAAHLAVVSADEIALTRLNDNMKDMDYTAGRTAMAEEIFAAYGLDRSVATGNTGNRTYDNVDAAKVQFWMDVMLDELTLISQGWSMLEEDPDVVIGFDVSRVAPLQRARRDVARFFLGEVTAGVRTPDEYRPISPEPLDPKGSDTSDKLRADVAAEQAQAAIDAAEQAPGDQTESDAANPQSGSTTEPQKGRKGAERKVTASGDVVTAQQSAILGVLAGLYDRQAKVIAARLHGPKARRGTWLARPAGSKAVDVDQLWQDDVWDGQLRADGEKVLHAAVDAIGGNVAAQLGGAFLPPEKQAMQPLVDRLVGTNRTTKALVAAAVAEQPGDTLESVQGRVAEVFAQAIDSRAATIAQTETTAAAGFATGQAGEQSGAELQEWQTGGNPRETHVYADGQRVKVGERFSVGASNLLYPGDPEGDAAEIVNCNCSLALVVDGEVVAPLRGSDQV
jgi:phage portal protein BeeE